MGGNLTTVRGYLITNGGNSLTAERNFNNSRIFNNSWRNLITVGRKYITVEGKLTTVEGKLITVGRNSITVEGNSITFEEIQ